MKEENSSFPESFSDYQSYTSNHKVDYALVILSPFLIYN